MNGDSTHIEAWLYTSRFVENMRWNELIALTKSFAAFNNLNGLSGFLISDGSRVMQYLEGEPLALSAIMQKIIDDSRHTDVNTESYATERHRAYPSWSMKAVHPSDHEALFSSIEDAKKMTIGIRIARMLFDLTFA